MGHYPDMREQLEELHNAAARHNPRAPTPEQKAAFRERTSRVDAKTAITNIMRALEPKYDPDVIPAAQKAWEAWDDERDPHKKALLQLELALHVAGLMIQVEALLAGDGPR